MTRQQYRNWLDIGAALVIAWIFVAHSVAQSMGWV